MLLFILRLYMVVQFNLQQPCSLPYLSCFFFEGGVTGISWVPVEQIFIFMYLFCCSFSLYIFPAILLFMLAFIIGIRKCLDVICQNFGKDPLLGTFIPFNFIFIPLFSWEPLANIEESIVIRTFPICQVNHAGNSCFVTYSLVAMLLFNTISLLFCQFV